RRSNGRTNLQGALGFHRDDGREEPSPPQAGIHRRSEVRRPVQCRVEHQRGEQPLKAPAGSPATMDEKNHPPKKPVFIGEVKSDGQFNVVWKTKGPIKAQPWSPFIPGNDKKKDEPALMADKKGD